jgi:HPt (histidine-containing phosphotransfer) domain-containing protein
MEQAQSLYEKEDWKNYIIVVHGIKSAMMSIGAVKLSEMAKTLEFAGKGEEFAAIHKEHAPMIQEFERVMQILQDCKYLAKAELADMPEEKPMISDAQFISKLAELENATYEFDAQKMLPILDDLCQYSYHAKDLGKELKPVYKKVEMSDFMSAYETVVKIKEKL